MRVGAVFTINREEHNEADDINSDLAGHGARRLAGRARESRQPGPPEKKILLLQLIREPLLTVGGKRSLARM